LVLGKSRGTTSGLKVHVFCPMLKDKRDAVKLIAERWKLAIYSAGWEPKRFIVVHVTPKSKAPSRVIGVKVSTTVSPSHPPAFDPLVDMDPRLVVSFLDLPRDADISALVLRFGGECELVWLNDKNALAVFNDPARAATAMRRLDHGSVYNGAVVVLPNGGVAAASSATSAWGGAGAALKGNPWKKAIGQEPGWKEGLWGDEEWSGGGSADMQASAWKKEAPIAASLNRWSVLDAETSLSSSAASLRTEDPGKRAGSSSGSVLESGESGSNSAGQHQGNSSGTEMSEVVDDWEKACD
jgi:transcriptional repressor NF-X1